MTCQPWNSLAHSRARTSLLCRRARNLADWRTPSSMNQAVQHWNPWCSPSSNGTYVANMWTRLSIPGKSVDTVVDVWQMLICRHPLARWHSRQCASLVNSESQSEILQSRDCISGNSFPEFRNKSIFFGIVSSGIISGNKSPLFCVLEILTLSYTYS